ncbi:MAG: chemotaxis protein CheW, partial [Acidobacteria bacterium]|nr:chemotaxis protein CheW [Acidobacteriota bacterium]
EKIPAENVELAAGRGVVQYRGRILPLIPLAEVLGGGPGAAIGQLQVVVCRNGGAEFGLVVDDIADIIDETVAHPGSTNRTGLLGSAVVGGRVTDFLDLDVVAEWAGVGSNESLERLSAVLAENVATNRGEASCDKAVWR